MIAAVPSSETSSAVACRTSSAANGSPSCVTSEPTWLIVWPDQSFRKSGCPHSSVRGQSTRLLPIEALRVSVRRGGVEEAVHRVHAIAVRDGSVVEAAGDPGLVAFLRSSAKPLQALPLA